MRRVTRVLLVVATMALVISSATFRSSGEARAQDATAAAIDTAVLLADLEIAGDFDTLYGLLHPDAQAVVPYAAMAGWYASDFLPRGPSPIEVLDVRFVDWTWGVNGVTYPWTAEVAYRQSFWDDGANAVVETVVHLVEADGSWRWFFGRDMSFLAAQTDRFATAPVAPAPVGPPPLSASPDFPAALVADLDAFWSARFAAAGLAYVSPGVVAFTDEIATPCSLATAALGPAAYCPVDATIYWETDWLERLRASGDFAWAAVIAHEWGHHVQALLGLSPSLAPDAGGERFPIDLELQSDCLGGAYAQDAEWRGLLAPGDVSAATAVAFASGDAAEVPWYDAGAHGTPDQRAGSFLAGYAGGTTGCGLPL